LRVADVENSPKRWPYLRLQNQSHTFSACLQPELLLEVTASSVFAGSRETKRKEAV
jgi:hypothetical protein